ncbi:MAG TPA: CAP domain-containing protein, partial [Thermomicrobiales bacterium]|nr:CAP domain-containing protein [Thermomicrobiales bacterium]
MWTRRWALCACCALLLAGGGAGVVARERDAPAAAYCPSAQERAFLDLINAYRKRHHKGALALSAPLGAAARFHSQDMAKRQRIKGHKLTNGDGPLQNMRRFGFDGNAWGENLAWEAPDAATVF